MVSETCVGVSRNLRPLVDGALMGTIITPTTASRLTTTVSLGRHFFSATAEMLPTGTHAWPSQDIEVTAAGLTMTLNCGLTSISGKYSGTIGTGSSTWTNAHPGPYTYTLTLVQNGVSVTGTTRIESTVPGLGQVWGDYEVTGTVQRGILGGSIQVVLTDTRYLGGERGGTNPINGLHDGTCLKRQEVIYAPVSTARIDGTWTGSCTSSPGTITLTRTGDTGILAVVGTITIRRSGALGGS